jgi:hypothetical protein
MIFQLNTCKNIFRPLFCHILQNSAIYGLQFFQAMDNFFASFGLFGRKFGHLATVIPGLLMGE